MADRIEALLKAWEPTVRKAFIEAVKAIRDQVVLTDLVEMLKRGDVEGSIRAVGLDPARFRPLARAIEQAYEAGGEDAMLAIKPMRSGPVGVAIGPKPAFDIRNPAADAFLRGHTTDLITQITDDQRRLVREAMRPLITGEDPMLTGQTPQKIAMDLVGRINRATGRRDGGLIGLTADQSRWASNYEAALSDPARLKDALDYKLRERRFDRSIAKALREGKPLPAEMQQTMVASYRNKALLYRGNTIALNEASTALHASQVEAWDQAVAKGVVDASKARRFWVTAGDDHVRPTHRAVPGMNKAGVGLHEPFNTPKGPALQPGWSFDPGCRCRVRVRVVEPA